MCVSLLAGMDIHEDQFLVGDIFMRKFYTIFDRDNDRVGIARAITKTTELNDPTYHMSRNDEPFALSTAKK
jgi:hypothetical protein